MPVPRFDTAPVVLQPSVDMNWMTVQEHVLPAYVEIEDTGAAGSLNEAQHGLARVPRGLRIVNIAIPNGVGPVAASWYREDGTDPNVEDDVWTDSLIRVRFSHANLRVLLEVF